MADYGTSFGFLLSDRNVRGVAEGRYRTPAGSALMLGTLVEVNTAKPGELKQSASNAKVVPGFAGLLLQELDFEQSVYEPAAEFVDSYMKGVARPGKLSVITSGAGTKVWLQNRAAVNRIDGRTVPAVTIVNTTGLAVGDGLGWDGAKYVKVDGSTITNAVAVVTGVNSSTGRVEAVLQA